MKRFLLILTLLFASNVHAQSERHQYDLTDAKTIHFSDKTFVLVENPDTGRLALTNGRYWVDAANIVDLWTFKTIDSIAKFEKTTQELDPIAMDLDIARLGNFVIGNSDAQSIVLLIADPSLPNQKKLIRQYIEYYKRSSDTRLSLVFAPAKPANQEEVQKILCEPDAFVFGLKAFAKDEGHCTQNRALARALAVATTLDVKSLPYLVDANNRVTRSIYDMKEYLK